MPEGVFITFEGGEGTGKSTQIARLVEQVRSAGREVVLTREPGGTSVAEAIRSVLLDPAHEPDGITEILLLEAARHDHVEQLIRPALQRGAVVISDRFADSSTVYQGLVRGLGAAMVRQLNALATGGLMPHRTVVLDMDPDQALGRARDRNQQGDGGESRLDDEPIEFHRSVRDAFLRLAATDERRFRVVDASGSADDVFGRVLSAVGDLLP
jgi:dTMP kinase